MIEKRGIVAKVCNNNCIVLTPQGIYRKVPLPSSDIKVGAEVFYRETLLTSVKPWLMAACLLILFVSYPMYSPLLPLSRTPQAAAYVSLDIDPSLEISVDKHLRVIEVRWFNDEAANLVEQLSLEGKGLNDALVEVIDRAIAQNYIVAEQNQVIIATISSAGTVADPIDQVELHQVLENSVVSRGFSGEVKIYGASDKIRTIAGNRNMSTGRYLIYEQLIQSGHEISIEDINSQDVTQLAAAYNMDLLPNFEQVIVKTSPNQPDPQLAVNYNGQMVGIGDYVKNQAVISTSGTSQDKQDANVSRSYSARKSRISQTPASADEKMKLVSTAAIKGKENVKDTTKKVAVKGQSPSSSRIKSEIARARTVMDRPLF